MKRAALWSAISVMLSFLLVLAAMGTRSLPDVTPTQTPSASQTQAQSETVAQSEAQETQTHVLDAQKTLQLKTADGIQEISMEEYLLGVVCSEMPPQFELEALKAQAVASRTFTLYQCSHSKHVDCDVCSDSGCCQAWRSEQQLAELFGEQWDSVQEKVELAISQTDGEVLMADGTLIDAVYFACSGGQTESAAAVWGGEVPYLQSVESPGEEIAASYQDQQEISFEKFRESITQENADADLSGTPSSWFGTVTYTDGGGVSTIEIGGAVFSGTKLRTLFQLNSTKFTIAVTADSIVFETRGKGHRVGMSQYGAQAMALSGSDYQAILSHYYTDVTLTTYTQENSGKSS